MTTATAGDQVSTESNDVELSAEESVKERGNEESKASEQILVIEKDTVSQEEEREQSVETHSDTGMCTLYSSENYHYYHCVLHVVLFYTFLIHPQKRYLQSSGRSSADIIHRRD